MDYNRLMSTLHNHLIRISKIYNPSSKKNKVIHNTMIKTTLLIKT